MQNCGLVLTFYSEPREGNWVVRLISASLASNFASRLVVVALVVAFSLRGGESRGAKGIERSSKSSSRLTRSLEPTVVTSIIRALIVKITYGRRKIRKKGKKENKRWRGEDKAQPDDYTNNDCVFPDLTSRAA
jgi:hypothetical protein